MFKFTRSPSRSPAFEAMEGRRLLAASDFGAAAAAIHFAEASAAFPTATGAGQTIAVIDSGIDYTHPSLGGGFGPGFKVVGGHDFVDNDDDPMDELGHGTEVAGVIAAKPASTNLGSQYQGIAPDAKLVALRVDDADFDSPVPDAKIEAALQWCVDHLNEFGITIVNISYGQGAYDSPTVSTVYGDEIVALRDAGVTIVASSGNGGVADNQGINTPAADPSVISVGSVGLNGTISSFSQRGGNLTLLAPGEEIETTFLGGSYGLEEGTSFSAPIVSGAVALMRNIDPTLKPADVTSILRASGVATFDGGPKSSNVTRLIYPRLDLLNALSLTSSRKPGTNLEQLAIGSLGNQSALATDAQGVTHFVYYNVQTNTMNYATRNTSGQWSTIQTVDSSLPFQGYYLSMAVDTVGQPAIAYFDGSNGDLKYAHNTGTSWDITNVDSKNSVGAYPSVVFDRNGLALVTYYRKTTGDLRAARRDFVGNWTITTVAEAGDVGRSTSAAVSSNGTVGVAYEDSTRGWVGYGQMNPRTGVWATTIADKKTRGAAYISTTFSTEDDSPWISYYDSFPANLKVAHFANRAWQTETVASRGATGLFTTIYFAGSDEPNVLYWDKSENRLMNADFDGSWTADILKENAGRFASAAIDRNNATFRFAFYTGANLQLDARSI